MSRLCTCHADRGALLDAKFPNTRKAVHKSINYALIAKGK